MQVVPILVVEEMLTISVVFGKSLTVGVQQEPAETKREIDPVAPVVVSNRGIRSHHDRRHLYLTSEVTTVNPLRYVHKPTPVGVLHLCHKGFPDDAATTGHA